LKPLDDAQKSYRVANFSFFNKVGPTFYVSSQLVFIVEISYWVRWKGIFMHKNGKIKKLTTIFFNFDNPLTQIDTHGQVFIKIHQIN
jgi:hypothetical protein